MKSAHKLTPQGAIPMAKRSLGWLSAAIVLLSCSSALAQSGNRQLIERGRQLFLNETFAGPLLQVDSVTAIPLCVSLPTTW